MATIGSFTKNDTGFSGSVKTLTLNVKATFRADDSENDKAPDYRIFAGARGAATSRSSWTTPASPPRSTPAWLRPRTAKATR